MKNLSLAIILGLALLFVACNPGGDITPDLQQEERLISREQAIQIATDFFVETANGARTTETPKLRIKEVQGSHNKTAIYIINNELGGWQIIAGTKVESPILAYDFENFFTMDSESYNEGLKMWVDNSIKSMVLAYENIDEYYKQFKIKNIAGKEPPPDDDCVASDVTDGPLLFINNDYMEWWQYWPTNMHSESCPEEPNYPNNSHGPVGCGPVAVGMVLRFHESPSTYTWNLMPADITWITLGQAADTEIGEFFSDIVDAFEPWYYDTNCGSSGSLTSMFDNLDNTLDDFGFDASQISSLSDIRNEINAARPVIAVGGTIDIINWSNSTRHIWVIDGVREKVMCPSNNQYSWVYCNFGWGSENVGWYSYNSYYPDGDNLSHNLKYFKITEQ